MVVTAGEQPGVVADDEPVAATASLRTVSDDVWGGFTSGLTFSNREPTITGGGTGSTGNGPTVAAGLVSVGTLALLSGLAMAEVNRRRRALSVAGSATAAE